MRKYALTSSSVGGGGSGGFGRGVVFCFLAFFSLASNKEGATGTTGLSPTGDMSLVFFLFSFIYKVGSGFVFSVVFRFVFSVVFNFVFNG